MRYEAPKVEFEENPVSSNCEGSMAGINPAVDPVAVAAVIIIAAIAAA